MARMPVSVGEFLSGKRIAVAGVSRSGDSAANGIFRKLRASGYDVVPVNPNATQLEGAACYPDVGSVPGDVDGIVIATHPAVSADVAQQAIGRGVRRIWFHRSFGEGSVSPEALDACARGGVSPIVGGCPFMYCKPVDLAHSCMRTWLAWRGRVPR